MAKKASPKASTGGKKTRSKSSGSGSAGGKAVATRPARSRADDEQSDIVDALLKLLQSPLVIDLLAVGATAALAAITETRSSRAEGTGNSKKTLKAAGTAAAAAVGRRLKSEFEEITAASKRSAEKRDSKAAAEA